MEEASCESTIFGFRHATFGKTRKSFFATRSRRDAIFGNSHHESATRFSGNPKVFSEGSLKRNADFRVRPPLGLYNTKRHRIRENGLPKSVEAPEGASRPCRLSIVPGPAGLTVVGTISVPPRARLCPNFEHCQFPSNFRPGAVYKDITLTMDIISITVARVLPLLLVALLLMRAAGRQER